MTPSSDLDHTGQSAGEWGPPAAGFERDTGTPLGGRLTPEGVRQLRFARSPIGRRGYHEGDVEHFRSRVVHEIGQSSAEKAELREDVQRLREEVQRLRDYYRTNQVDVDAAPGRRTLTSGALDLAIESQRPSAQAVNVMSQAQQAADQHIAQAEDYARRLVSTARQQYEDILVSAHEQAQQAAAEAGELYRRTGLGGRGGEETSGELEYLQSRVAYMRTFAQVTQVQLRSILDALRQELDQLTVLPSAGQPSAGHGAQPAAIDSGVPETAGLPLRVSQSSAAGHAPVRTS